MNNSFDFQEITNVIESAISTFDYNTTDIIQVDIPICILESLLDVYYFKGPHEK